MKTKNYPWRYGWFLGMYYMANGIYQGYASKYFEATGMSTAMLSVILAFTPLISIFTQPLWGTVGDRAKSRNRVLGFLIVASAALVLLYRVSNSFWWLLPMSILFSSVYTSIQPMGDSIVLEALSPENHAFGPLRMMGTISFALTNLIWGLILTPGRMNLVVYMTAIMLMMVLVSTRVLPPTEGHQSSTGRKMNMTAILKMKHMPGLLVLLMLLQLTMGYFYSFFSIYFTSMPGGSSRLLGLCYFMSAMSEIPFLLNADRLFEKLGVGKLLSMRRDCAHAEMDDSGNVPQCVRRHGQPAAARLGLHRHDGEHGQIRQRDHTGRAEGQRPDAHLGGGLRHCACVRHTGRRSGGRRDGQRAEGLFADGNRGGRRADRVRAALSGHEAAQWKNRGIME